ncbi:short transient receptor potential channel 6-like [Saccoglossus kowalevskii]
MFSDVIKLIAILVVELVAFSIASQQVYAVGVGILNSDITFLDGSTDISATVQGQTLFYHMEQLFWSLFGLQELEDFSSPIHSVDTAAKLLVGLYDLLAVIVLLNMLIAQISDTYNRIEASSGETYNFARAEQILEFRDHSDAPVPFNIVLCIVRGAKCLCKKSTATEDGQTHQESSHRNEFDFGLEDLPQVENDTSARSSIAESIAESFVDVIKTELKLKTSTDIYKEIKTEYERMELDEKHENIEHVQTDLIGEGTRLENKLAEMTSALTVMQSSSRDMISALENDCYNISLLVSRLMESEV